MNREEICPCGGCRGQEKRVGDGGRGEEKQNTVARSLIKENAMRDTRLAPGAATSVLDEDPRCRPLSVPASACACVRKHQALSFRKPARGSSLPSLKRCPLTVGQICSQLRLEKYVAG